MGNNIVIRTLTLQQNPIFRDHLFSNDMKGSMFMLFSGLGTRIGPISISGILPLFMKSCVSLQGELNSLWSIKVWAHLVHSELFASFYVSGLHPWIVINIYLYIKVTDGCCGKYYWSHFVFYPISLMSVIMIILCILICHEEHARDNILFLMSYNYICVIDS